MSNFHDEQHTLVCGMILGGLMKGLVGMELEVEPLVDSNRNYMAGILVTTASGERYVLEIAPQGTV